MSTETTGTTQASDVGAGASHKRTLIGRVTSAKMEKTVVVEVVRSVRHPIYGKYVRRRKKYKAHDENRTYKAGDVVEIREHRPLSREKRWTVIRLVDRPEET